MYTTSQLGFPGPGEFPFRGADDDDRNCSCERCQAKAAEAERAASQFDQFFSSKSAAQQPSSQSSFNFDQALRNDSVKAKIAEGKANRTHDLEDSTHRFGGKAPMSIVKSGKGDVAVSNGHPKSPAMSSHSKAFQSSASAMDISSLVFSTTFDICYSFVQSYLPACGFSDRVMCNVLERLTLYKESASTEIPMDAVKRIFGELHIEWHPEDLQAFLTKHSVAHSSQQQPSAAKRSEAEALAKQLKRANIPNPEGFHALLEKQRAAKSDMTFGVTDLSRAPNTDDASDGDESSPYVSSEDDVDDDELPPCESCIKLIAPHLSSICNLVTCCLSRAT